jgi:16S rRNA (guanine966-N2)-methyltransferase
VRIIAGAAKGRRLDAPKSGTRPMTGRARESIFSILALRIDGARVMDLYAGSGSLGLEALSRGASDALFVENGRQAASILERNIDRVGLGGRMRKGDVRTFLGSQTACYDLIFVDPPYAKDDDEINRQLVQAGQALVPGGIMVLHRQSQSQVAVPEFLHTIDERRYGDAVVTMMERPQE